MDNLLLNFTWHIQNTVLMVQDAPRQHKMLVCIYILI